MARDYRAEYQRRQAAAQALGYKSYRDQRARRAANQLKAGDVRARPKPIQVTAGGQRITKTAGAGAGGYAAAAVDAAAARGDRVVITATFRNAAGEPRTRRMDRLPGGGPTGPAGAPGPGTGPVPLGAVHVVAGTSGMSAKEIRRIISDYYDGDFYEFLFDLWESIYGE